MTTILRQILLTKNLFQPLFLSSFLLCLTSCRSQDILATQPAESITLPASQDKREGNIVEQINEREYIVFFGNPGVGKSTLLNSIIQEQVFASGFNYGSGITTHQQQKIYEGKVYIDTPGLDDIKHRPDAAKEIEKALKNNGRYKIIFLLTLDAGRIRASDLTTINTVCNTIRSPLEYGIVFNKVSKKEQNSMSKLSKEEIFAPFVGLQKQPSSITTITMDREMEDGDKKFLLEQDEDREKLLSFIDKLRTINLNSEDVTPIIVDNFPIKTIEIKEEEEVFQELGTLIGEQTALEAKQKNLEEKVKNYDKAAADNSNEKYQNGEKERKAKQLEEVEELERLKKEIKNLKEKIDFQEKILIKKDEEIQRKQQAALDIMERVNFLTQAIATQKTKYFLHQACASGSEGIVTSLCSNPLVTKITINQKDENKLYPLHYAACNNNKEIIELLLRAGAMINGEDDKGLTPLHYAVSRGHVEVVKALISLSDKKFGEIKVDHLLIDAVAEGFTPLHLAVKAGELSVVKCLVEHADFNKEGPYNWTPLHYAIKHNRDDIVAFLLSEEFKETQKIRKKELLVRAKNYNGMTPLHLAAEQDNYFIVDCLLKNGAKATDGNIIFRKPSSLASDKRAIDLLKRAEEKEKEDINIGGCIIS